ncbi:intermembrane phospholipid transport protein YdbH family protein [Pseudodesulfovibrio aespoeensis]|uniref:intermembrane phospholipid transport protein YdbH family protein n=1 Tax=Pseudodesulfovibrio aespoeensis TaxID=182210 RepID=UPI002357D89B|nr:YdbH domain-containing protein [Pseudodesulfovibrio aespoeensis]MCG2732201.1 YdbH domain-containing protein [Pseudodesulfovibrio aespoeensis]
MSKSLARQLLKWTLRITPWVLALALGAGWALSAWTPTYLERLIPQLARDMGLPVTEFHIRSAGLFSADIGPVELALATGDPDDGLRLESVRVTYTPASLRLGRVHRVVIRGVSLAGSHDGQTFRLPLLDLFQAAESGAKAGKTPLPVLPFDQLVIEDSILTLDTPAARLFIPFAATVTPPGAPGEPMRVTAALRVRDQDISISADLGPTLDDLTLTVAAQGLRLASLGDLLPLAVDGLLDLELTAALDLSRPESIVASASVTLRQADLACLGATLADDTLRLAAALAEEGVAVTLAPLALTGPHPLTLHASEIIISGDMVRADFTLASAATLPEGTVIPGAFEARRENGGWTVALTMEKKDSFRAAAGGRSLRLGGLTLALRGAVSPAATETQTGVSAAMVLEARTRSCSLDGADFATGSATLRLPLAWPAPARHEQGRLTVAAIRSGARRLGSLNAALWQESLGVRFTGDFNTDLLPKLRASLAGNASLADGTASATFAVKGYPLPKGFDPGTLAPGLAGVAVAGTLDAEGAVHYNKAGLKSRLGVFVTDGSLVYGGEGQDNDGVRLDGLHLYFESPDIVDFRSDPAQVLTFERLRTADIEMTDGVIAFQVEPGGVTLVERARFAWCGGHVESRAFRVVPGRDEYDVTLHCSGLRLSELLAQLGLARARGDSTLSGELPVVWKGGQLSFHQGFLHSTPGEGGVIQVEGLDNLVAAIPEGTPERAQIELARAAMQDFEYNWVRLRADTVGRDLLMRLSVDGKPAKMLPFVYRKDFGGFVKVEGDIQGSNFQGLRLDVNFSLPLDRILLYKNVIGRIE